MNSTAGEVQTYVTLQTGGANNFASFYPYVGK